MFEKKQRKCHLPTTDRVLPLSLAIFKIAPQLLYQWHVTASPPGCQAGQNFTLAEVSDAAALNV